MTNTTMIKDEIATEHEVALRQLVGDAAAQLDEHAFDWRDRIDPAILDIARPCHCILGQLYGWFEGKRVLTGRERGQVSQAFHDPATLPYWLEELSA